MSLWFSGRARSIIFGIPSPTKYLKASTSCVGNPLYHWTHLELKKYFDIEELLFRKPINIADTHTNEYYKNKVILITGGGGSIGSELCRQLVTFGIDKLVLFDNAETPMHNLRLELEEKYPQKFLRRELDIPGNAAEYLRDLRQLDRKRFI